MLCDHPRFRDGGNHRRGGCSVSSGMGRGRSETGRRCFEEVAITEAAAVAAAEANTGHTASAGTLGEPRNRRRRRRWWCRWRKWWWWQWWPRSECCDAACSPDSSRSSGGCGTCEANTPNSHACGSESSHHQHTCQKEQRRGPTSRSGGASTIKTGCSFEPARVQPERSQLSPVDKERESRSESGAS